jgi:signal transduction histidine kinase
VEFPFRNWLSGLQISQRLVVGFGLLLLALLGYGAYALDQMRTLAEHTARIHDHPVAVERAILEAELAHVKIHRAMEDISLSTDEEEIFEFVRRARESEKIVHRSFDLLKERFLGDPSMVDEAFQQFLDWEPSWEEVIELTLRGDRERVAAIMRRKDGQREHIALVESKLGGLRLFAENKRAEFLGNSQRVQERSVRVTGTLLLIMLVVTGVVAWAISRGITTPLVALTEAAERIAEGDFDHRVAVHSNDELGTLARAFNSMAQDIAGHTRTIRDENAEAQRRAATRAAESAEARERRALARDLHDALSQSLALAGTKLAAMRGEAGGSSLAARLGEVQSLIANADERARTLTFRLSPPVLHDLGIVAAAEWLAEDLGHQFGLHVSVRDDGLLKPLGEEIREALFRSLRELLINVARHSQVDKAQVGLVREGEVLTVTVADGGIGFDLSRRGAGFGLMSVRERLEELGGELEIESAPGLGTHARMIVPLSATEGSERPEPVNDSEAL